MAKKFLSLEEAFGKSKFLTGNIVDKFDYWIERNEDKLTTYIITFGGDNKKDISDYLDIDLNTNAYDIPNIFCSVLIKHFIFNDELKVLPRTAPPYKLNNYRIIKEINELIPWYVEVTGDEDFSKLDNKVYEYIDDRLTELETSEFPYNTYKKWDDLEKLSELIQLILKGAEENKK